MGVPAEGPHFVGRVFVAEQPGGPHFVNGSSVGVPAEGPHSVTWIRFEDLPQPWGSL